MSDSSSEADAPENGASPLLSFSMSSDCLTEDQCRGIGSIVFHLQQHMGLDLQGLRQLEITSQYVEALARLGDRYGRDTTRTDGPIGVGMASAQHFFESDNLVHHVILDRALAIGLLDGADELTTKRDVQLLVHELGHVHEMNLSWRSLSPEWRGLCPSGRFGAILPLAVTTWKEFYANLIAATVHDIRADTQIALLGDCLDEVPELIREAISLYRRDHDLTKLMADVRRHMRLLFTAAAYVQANLYAGTITEDDSYAQAVETAIEHRLDRASFRATWQALGTALEHLQRQYPRQWGGFHTMADLVELIAAQFRCYGIDYQDRPGGLYIAVPLPRSGSPRRVNG